MLDKITVQNLKYQYPNHDDWVLNIPSWQIEKGDQVFLYGASGSGKSTFLNVLSGIIPTKHGQVNIFGTELNHLSSKQRDLFRAKKIGYIFQRFNLIPYLTAIDNVKMACLFSGMETDKHTVNEQIAALMTRLGIDQQHWHKRCRELSVGQQQRIAIVRALITQPELLIVDEPTSSLDMKNRDTFMSILLEQASDNKTTLIFVSHDTALAEMFAHKASFLDINCG